MVFSQYTQERFAKIQLDTLYTYLFQVPLF